MLGRNSGPVSDSDNADDKTLIEHRPDTGGVAMGQSGVVSVTVREEDPVLDPIGENLTARSRTLFCPDYSHRIGQFLAALRQNGPILFSVPPAFDLAQHPGLALVDRVADLAQQLVTQACPTVSVGLDDKGEISKKMRLAYLMLALEV